MSNETNEIAAKNPVVAELDYEINDADETGTAVVRTLVRAKDELVRLLENYSTALTAWNNAIDERQMITAERDQLKAELEAVKGERDELVDEKERRGYYQNIVYEVCQLLDHFADGVVVCGTIEEPSTDVQQTLKNVIRQRRDAVSEASKLQAQNTTLSAKVAELEGDAAVGRLVRTLSSDATLTVGGERETTEIYCRWDRHPLRRKAIRHGLLEALQALQGEVSE